MRQGKRWRKKEREMTTSKCILTFLLAFVTTALEANSQSLEIPFVVTRPAGSGPFPAVVLLHDCSGLGPMSSGATWRWSTELTRQVFVTIWPDSFSTRGFPDGVCRIADRGSVAPRVRTLDAYAALAHLQTLQFVDAKHVAVMGGSHGGTTTLASIVAAPSNTARGKPGFAAAIALYPTCNGKIGEWQSERRTENGITKLQTSGIFRTLSPTLILVGDQDDWTPAEPCQRLAEAAKAAGERVEIKVYAGAHHSFDSPARLRFDADRINMNSLNGRGATTGGNDLAWANARHAVHAFLARTVAIPLKLP